MQISKAKLRLVGLRKPRDLGVSRTSINRRAVDASLIGSLVSFPARDVASQCHLAHLTEVPITFKSGANDWATYQDFAGVSRCRRASSDARLTKILRNY